SAVPTHTLGSIATGHDTVVVASYDARSPDRAISPFSSAGPTRDGRPKPEVSAPGQGIFAARSRSQGVVQMSGTSMAAPHVTGLIALLLSAGERALGRHLDIKEVRDLLL